MKTLSFKTNINCGDCISKLTPFLDGNEHIESWNVDTNNPDKILTVSGDDITPDIVINTINETGFSAVEVK